MGLFDMFKKKNKDCVVKSSFTDFVKLFKPGDNLIKPTEEELKAFSKVLPL